ncbi:hypothetical protein Plhal304r1_c032g0102381 [Plasmopara halstedii]
MSCNRWGFIDPSLIEFTSGFRIISVQNVWLKIGGVFPYCHPKSIMPSILHLGKKANEMDSGLITSRADRNIN